MAGALKPWTAAVLRWLVGGLFIVAGVLKLADPTAFLQSIEGYRMLPGWAAPLCAVYLPWLEVFCGLGLVLKKAYRGALALMVGMTLVFIAALVSAWTRGLDIECGCFGSGDPFGQLGAALARDALLVLALAWLGWREVQARR